ncbi:parathyroid hormone/parathyroid hormone-related peptide receptor [Plakobranchus ocellatus]|uniref:Parathyroid hormone/parathyroid hormone-related peptide receptor n=1 Tax=Plakobranchus ocellatus TaxID=259542 RepID=A0AAV4DQ60_9GAST|nr:parathyroid hormone/parathyroid hormone-related peptide receptor [Plakobranchus ocellatus]
MNIAAIILKSNQLFEAINPNYAMPDLLHQAARSLVQIVLSLQINFLFFLDINRMLLSRVMDNRRHAGRSKYRKVGKFILVLIPLFGIMYIVLNVAFPSEVNAKGYNVVYLYVEMGYNSFQVHLELRRSWHQHRSRRHNSKVFKQSTSRVTSHVSSYRSAGAFHKQVSRSTNQGRNGYDHGCMRGRNEQARHAILKQSVSNQSTSKEHKPRPCSVRVQGTGTGPGTLETVVVSCAADKKHTELS